MVTINIRYAPGNGVYIIEIGANEGGLKVGKFLDAHSHLFGIMPCNNSKVWQKWLEPHRIEKFKAYAQSKGFTVVSK